MASAENILIQLKRTSWKQQKQVDILIELISFGIDIASDESHEIVVAIIDYLRNLGYSVTVSKKVNGYYASLLVSWVKPLEKDQKNKED